MEIKEKNQLSVKENLIWSKTFGGENSEGASSVIQTSDGGFMICAYINIQDYNSVLMMIKTNTNGNEQWSYAFGGAGWECGKSVCETSTGDFVATGYTTTAGSGLQDVLVVKINSTGQQVWNKTFGGSGLDIGYSICETSNEELLVCGYTTSFGEGEDDIYVLKLDENGNEIWSKTFGGTASDMGRKLIELSDGNYAILGNTGSYGAGNRDVYLLKTDQEGNVLWTQTYGTSGYQDAFSIVETGDGGFIIAGHSDIHGADLLEAYVIKTNSFGYLTWEGLYEGSDNFYDYAKDVVETQNGNFLVCGHTMMRETRKNQAFLFLLDQEGTKIWAEEYGDVGSDWANSICGTDDGNFVVAGHSSSYGFGKYDVWLFKLQNPVTYTGLSAIRSYMRII